MSQERILIRIDPHRLRIIALVAGLLLGILMVVLDPWLRFADIPTRINWREALLTGIVMGGYAMLLGWMITEFWHSMMVWLIVILTTPLITGVLAFWNEITAVFGTSNDLIFFMPIVLIFHGAMGGLTILYLYIVRRLPGREWLVFTAVPVVIILLTFLVVGRIRWANQDARDVMAAVNQYAEGAIPGDYEIEYLGINYGVSVTGNARIYSDGATQLCRILIYESHLDVSCDIEE